MTGKDKVREETTAESMRVSTAKARRYIKDNLLNRCLDTIWEAANEGFAEHPIQLNMNERFAVDEVVNVLKFRGFFITTGVDVIKVSWR